MLRASVDNPGREDGAKGNGAFRYLPRTARESHALTQEMRADMSENYELF